MPRNNTTREAVETCWAEIPFEVRARLILTGFSIDPILSALSHGQRASELLKAMHLDSLELDNGYHRCRHCRRWCHFGEAIMHGSDCVVGLVAGFIAAEAAADGQ